MSEPDPKPASQDDIDALLAELGGSPARPANDPTAETMPAGGTQADIDALLGAIGGGSAAKDGDDIDALLSEISNTAEGRASGGLTNAQTKRLDAVLESIQSGPQPIQGGALGLSSDQLENLVAKHAPSPDSAAPSESEISQDDIDDLVAQLTAVVGGTGPITLAQARGKSPTVPDSGGRPLASITGAAPAIKAPPAKTPAAKTPPTKSPSTATVVTPAAGKPTAKPAARPASGGRPAPKPAAAPDYASPALVGGGAAAIGVLAPAEIRGARWLLVAAVLLLAVCAAGMGAMVRTLSGLAGQLARNPTTGTLDADRFALALTAARNLLADGDAVDAAIGVQALERLKADHPNRAQELTLELARHWRAQGAHRKAADAYASVIDKVLIGGDPRILLEYTASLTVLGDYADAVRQLYSMLAQEQILLAREDRLGHPKSPEEQTRDRMAIQQAYLQLGDLLSRQNSASGRQP